MSVFNVLIGAAVGIGPSRRRTSTRVAAAVVHPGPIVSTRNTVIPNNRKPALLERGVELNRFPRHLKSEWSV